MDLATKLRYQGSISTPPLWTNNTVSPFKQIELTRHFETIEDSTVFKNQRLGKLVEAFVIHQLQHHYADTWICDNLQIQAGNRTVGEIDALYYDEEGPVHLEIAYKFYLYDTLEDYEEPLAYWIGPNRKDNLFYKLEKLRRKQFPLLHHARTKPYLDRYHLELKDLQQKLCFKAQLFLPYHRRDMDIHPLNSDCIAGFYLSYQQIEAFKTCEFFLPTKLDWLVIPHHNVDWINYSSATAIIETVVNNQRSPLVWIKQNDGKISKCFITFW